MSKDNVVSLDKRRKQEKEADEFCEAKDLAGVINWEAVEQVMVICIDKEGFINVVHNVSEESCIADMLEDAREMLLENEVEKLH